MHRELHPCLSHRVRTRRLDSADHRIHRRAVFSSRRRFGDNLRAVGAKAQVQGIRDGDILTHRKGEQDSTILRGDSGARTKLSRASGSGGLCCFAGADGIFKRRFLPGFFKSGVWFWRSLGRGLSSLTLSTHRLIKRVCVLCVFLSTFTGQIRDRVPWRSFEALDCQWGSAACELLRGAASL